MEKLKNWLDTTLLGALVKAAVTIAGYIMYMSAYGMAWISFGVLLLGFVSLVEFGIIGISTTTVIPVFIGVGITYAFLTTLTTLLGMLYARLYGKVEVK